MSLAEKRPSVLVGDVLYARYENLENYDDQILFIG